MGFVVYVLKSESHGTFYYGHSADLEARLKRHNSGKVRSTKSKRPWKVHYVEEVPTKSEAYKRELFFKSIDGYRFLKSKSII
jgi:putative endonuclease